MDLVQSNQSIYYPPLVNSLSPPVCLYQQCVKRVSQWKELAANFGWLKHYPITTFIHSLIWKLIIGPSDHWCYFEWVSAISNGLEWVLLGSLLANLCVYRDIRASRVLRVPLELVEVRVFMERWPGHPRLKKKKMEIANVVTKVILIIIK